jgi:hypothetical protein
MRCWGGGKSISEKRNKYLQVQYTVHIVWWYQLSFSYYYSPCMRYFFFLNGLLLFEFFASCAANATNGHSPSLTSTPSSHLPRTQQADHSFIFHSISIIASSVVHAGLLRLRPPIDQPRPGEGRDRLLGGSAFTVCPYSVSCS